MQFYFQLLLGLMLNQSLLNLKTTQQNFYTTFQKSPLELQCYAVPMRLEHQKLARFTYQFERRRAGLKLTFLHEAGGTTFTAYFVKQNLISFQEAYPLSPGTDYQRTYFIVGDQLLETIITRDPTYPEYPEYTTIEKVSSRQSLQTFKKYIAIAQGLVIHSRPLKACPPQFE